MKGKSILMIYDHLETGGIETLILRATPWLLDHGYEIRLILRHKGKLFDQLDKRVEVKVYGSRYIRLFHPRLARSLFADRFYDDLDIVYTFRPEGLWIASVLSRVKKRALKVFNCVYHPREFFFHGKDHYETEYYSRIILQGFPKKNLAFMNVPCRVHHEEFFDLDLSVSPVVPLAVDVSRYRDIQRAPRKFKIVSIGNFKTFKTYNLYMIDVVDQLKKQGFDIEYEIYGDGELRQEMEGRIRKLGLGNTIYLKGQAKYEQLRDTLTDAYVFVGCGTAAIEAALCRVPSVVGIENVPEPMTYGYLHDMPGFAVGEQIAGAPLVSVEELIRNVFTMSDEQYRDIADVSVNYANQYELEKIMKEMDARFSDDDALATYDFAGLKMGDYTSFYLARSRNYVTSKFRTLWRKISK
ncbi:MAG TPA: glycosyltransferase family 4 protein [Chitinophagaceae bacterium]|nr:glycosyltransferase family 4 protein [Chitinophagaceae bacterium]